MLTSHDALTLICFLVFMIICVSHFIMLDIVSKTVVSCWKRYGMNRAPARHGFAAPVRLTARCVTRSAMHLSRHLFRWMGGKGSGYKLHSITIYYPITSYYMLLYYHIITIIFGHQCWKLCSGFGMSCLACS